MKKVHIIIEVREIKGEKLKLKWSLDYLQSLFNWEIYLAITINPHWFQQITLVIHNLSHRQIIFPTSLQDNTPRTER